MQFNIDTIIKAMLWDIPKDRRSDITKKILNDPVAAFRQDEQLFIKALNSLRWYELIKLIGRQELISLLTDSTIRKLFPPQRRTYYFNARRLLSKYGLPASGLNDVPFRKGTSVKTDLFLRTDNMHNILSNKLAALSRHEVKDVVDIVFISKTIPFNWEDIFKDASEKDLWANPVNAAEILEQFPVEKLKEIIWTDKIPDNDWFSSRINQIIPEMMEGSDNSLFKTM